MAAYGLDGQAVALGVAPHQVHALGADLDGLHLAGARLGAGQREGALVGKAIQHLASGGVRGHGGVVRQLVEIKAGLLSVEQIDLEGDAVHRDLESAGRFAGEHAGVQFEALGFADRRVVALDDGAWREQFLQRFREQRLPLVHGQRERLHHEMIAVAIDDHAGQPVALAPDEPAETRVHLAPCAVIDGLLEPALEKVEVEILALPGKTPGDDLRLGVVDGGAEQPILPVLERHDVAIGRLPEGLEHLAGIDPVVPVQDAGAGFDDESGHGGGGR